MTKLRAPLTFPKAIVRLADVLGYAEIARIVDRSDRTVRYWSEDDCTATPSLAQAKALDLAYRRAGGQGSPILESYALQLGAEIEDALADQSALAADIAHFAIEHAQAIAASIAVTQPGASPTDVHRAIAETEEACGAGTRLLARHKSFLPGTGAGRMTGGVS